MSSNGYNTKNKNIILDFFKLNPKSSFSVKEIHSYLCENFKNINITTIYRYLDKLESDGIVIKLQADSGKNACYQYIEDGYFCNEHLHLQCSECGRIIHLDCNYMNEIVKHIADCHDFDIRCKSSVLYGLCNDCSAKKLK